MNSESYHHKRQTDSDAKELRWLGNKTNKLDATSTRPATLQHNSSQQTNSNISINGQSTSPNVSTSDNSKSRPTKLVFGLSSRTNRLRHDEYAERRSSSPLPISVAPASVAVVEQQPVLRGQRARETSSCPSRPSGGSKMSVTSAPKGVSNQVAQQLEFKDIEQAKGIVTDEKENSSRGQFPPNNKIQKQIQAQKDQKQKITHGSASSPANSKVRVSKQTTKSQTFEDKPAKDQPQVTKDEVKTSVEQPTSIRMQFNIPPPPPSKIGSNKSSLVSYAKSRIYDKPVNGTKFGSMNHLENKLPNAIVSGFKPPKQVNVSKARERWEGGEPFVKCKSRQRLALAQAGKKRQLHGIWSMTSVVANQQAQFQQALAQSSMPRSSSLLDVDPAVKVLSRGSVLERVQQFEKAPNEADLEAVIDLNYDNSMADTSSSLTASDSQKQLAMTSSSLSIHSLGNDKTLTMDSNKQASQQLDRLTRDPLENFARSRPLEQRRLSFRRRSSSSMGSNSAFYIPKFYHPNGRPNTLELEMQKRNIVSCFDKLPARRASLVAPSNRRHFHSIALACGFSEYFKEPLYLYVCQTEKIWSQPLSPGSRKLSIVERTPSFTSSNVGNTTNNYRSSKTPLARSASIDSPNKLTNGQEIDVEGIGGCSHSYITCDQYLTCWRHLIEEAYDNVARFIHLLTFGQRNYLVPEDFIAMVQSIIDDHPGLKFLRAAPDFHMRYIQTVIARIYFSINKSWTGKISQSELRQSNFLAVLERLSKTDDINKITDYFSYEHFYVIYCKFWNLDQDHDLLISKEDLARHNDASISSRIIDRIFMGIVSRHIQQTGMMSYTDFVWFIMAEEDKKHPRSIEYWFRLMDMDGDGYISMYEMEYFYYEQVKRLELMNIEALPFLDCACQILDLVNPKEKNKISLSDLKRTKMVTIFFDTFINLEKYLEHESREFVSTRDVVINGVVISDWDRYANEEYESLVREESSV